MKVLIFDIRKKYFSSFHDRTIVMTCSSFFINALFGLGKLCFGIYYASIWFIILAGYDIVLCLARGQILFIVRSFLHIKEDDKKRKRQIQVYHRSGYFIVFLGLSYLILCIWMFFFDEKTAYPDYILYGVAAMAFYKIGSAIYGMVAAKKWSAILLSVLKTINFMDACVSIIAVQCAILAMKGSVYATSSSALFGMAVSLVFLMIGVYMIRKKFGGNKIESSNLSR